MANWMHVENQITGMVNELSRFINHLEKEGKIFLPNLRDAQSLYIFSDYSGNKVQRIISYSMLVIDQSSLLSFLSQQQFFWQRFNLGHRIIDYKGLNDEFKRRALVPFLNGCNNLNGIILTILFDGSTKSIFQKEIPQYLETQLSAWKNIKVREKFLRLRELILLILNGLGGEAQKIIWITDHYEIIANNFQLETANLILKQTIKNHSNFSIESFEFMSLENDQHDRGLEKLCSIPDLVAGGLVDFIGDYQKANIHPN